MSATARPTDDAASPEVFAAAASGRRVALAYAALVVLPALGVLWVLRVGERLPLPLASGAAAAPPGPSPGAAFDLPLFLVQIAVVLAVARGVGRLLRAVGQPQVVGEMLAGLLLGPSLLGLVAPGAYAALFPAGTVRFLNAGAQLGVVLFMFLMGLEIDVREVAARTRQNLVTSHAGIALPLFAGTATALFLYPAQSTGRTSFPVFALFLGCAMSITAFPVLARILSERGLAGTRFGVMAIECAALADLTAWVILALVLGLLRDASHGVAAALAWTVGGLAIYVTVMFAAVRPLARRLWARVGEASGGEPRIGEGALSGVLLLVLGSAIATEALHVHALFGAFVAGVVMPHDLRVRAAVAAPFRELLTVLLLPLFFAYAGLRANLGAFSGVDDWLLCVLVIAVAVASKLGASLVAARVMGASWRNAAALGALMNARGLVELILLTLGLQLGIISQPLFTAMLVMALVTTAMTTPLFSRILAR